MIAGVPIGFLGYVLLWGFLFLWTETEGIHRLSDNTLVILIRLWPLAPYLLWGGIKAVCRSRYKPFLRGVLYGFFAGTVIAIAILLELGNSSIG